jgi:xanthine dehydrogenase small subunit
LGALVVLMAWRKGRVVHRHVALEDYYLGYRKTVLAPDELLCWIVVPHPKPDEQLHCFKVSKRVEDDISSVCLVLNMQLQHHHVRELRIGVGGVAARPVRAVQTEAVLRGLSFHRAAGRNPPEHWFTTLADAPRPGVVRAVVRRAAAVALEAPPGPVS